jgi:periplasmic copper chaperone A
MQNTLLRAAFLAAVWGILISGCGPKSLQVKDVWARPATAGANSAVYFTIDNPLDQADTLVSVVCAAADQAELHNSNMDDGNMMMRPVDDVAVEANSQVDFAPGGLHVMLSGVKNELKVGDHFDLTLYFDQAGAVTVTAEVKEQ